MLTLIDEGSGTQLRDDAVVDMTVTGSGPPLLLLHGVEGTAADSEFVSALSADFTVYAPSHPGFGLSPRPNWCDSVDDLAYLYLDWMRAQGLDEVTLVGLQFGGWVAAEIAIRDSSRLSRLVLVDSVGVKVGGREERDIADVFAMPRTELDERMFATPHGRRGDLRLADPDAVLHIARNEEALAVYGWEPYLHNPRLSRWLARVDTPTTVIWGEQDGIVTPDYGRRLAALIPGAAFETVADAGHCAQIDQPSAVAQLITHDKGFLATRGLIAAER
ncbi:alpha/beta fold hydrolase [Streptomyces blattellae]|uniref:alpha/beta fold hydrolase n=1 Tax=Streptomyces blattellae TaxID=2569855 RepID=UPI001E5396C7|nr:alpha/beta hydrolase [Streptomyces blattellae]